MINFICWTNSLQELVFVVHEQSDCTQAHDDTKKPLRVDIQETLRDRRKGNFETKSRDEMQKIETSFSLILILTTVDNEFKACIVITRPM